jgi:hypothetical protein
MPNIDRGLWLRLIARQQKYADALARQAAVQRLDEVEAHIQSERQRRGMEPVTTDTGKVIAWVHTRPQSPGGR